MAIRRCPYCKAIIDESQKYCNNCGTQLLFPDDDPNEEPIKGEKIVDDDFPGGTEGRFPDIPEDQEKDLDEDDLDESSEREEIDLEQVLKGERVLPGEEEPDTFVDLREAEETPTIPKTDEESPVIEKPDLPAEASGPVIEIPVEPSETEEAGRPEPPPVPKRARRKKSAAAEPLPPPPPLPESAPTEETAEEPGIVEDTVVPLEEKTEDDVLALTPPPSESDRPPSVRIGNDTHDEIARLIADFEIRRRGLPVEDEPDLIPAEEGGFSSSLSDQMKPIEEDSAELLSEPEEPEEKELSVEEKRLGEKDEAGEFRWNRIESPSEDEDIKVAHEENPEEDADPDVIDERRPSLTGDTMEFQDEVMKKTISGSPAGPTMGIPETVSKLQEALPFAAPSDEVDIEKELGAIELPDKERKRKPDFRLDDFDLDKDLIRDDRDEIEDKGGLNSDEEGDAEDAENEERISEDREGEKISAPPSIVRLGIFRRVKALLFDLLIVAVFWVGAAGLAAGFLSVPILDLVAAAAFPLSLLFGSLLAAYLFLFLFFLGETPGGRLVTPKDGSSTD